MKAMRLLAPIKIEIMEDGDDDKIIGIDGNAADLLSPARRK